MTKSQREEIVRVAKPHFGDIEKDGFVAFSEWLVEHFGRFDIYGMDTEEANRLIQRLRSLPKESLRTKPIVDPRTPQAKESGFWRGVVRAMAKIYLRGYYDAKVGGDPPSLEEIETQIAQGLGGGDGT